jgi:hypothetical protein
MQQPCAVALLLRGSVAAADPTRAQSLLLLFQVPLAADLEAAPLIGSHTTRARLLRRANRWPTAEMRAEMHRPRVSRVEQAVQAAAGVQGRMVANSATPQLCLRLQRQAVLAGVLWPGAGLQPVAAFEVEEGVAVA